MKHNQSHTDIKNRKRIQCNIIYIRWIETFSIKKKLKNQLI